MYEEVFPTTCSSSLESLSKVVSSRLKLNRNVTITVTENSNDEKLTLRDESFIKRGIDSMKNLFIHHDYQLKKQDFVDGWENNQIGKGHYGKVFKATVIHKKSVLEKSLKLSNSTNHRPRTVAVKSLARQVQGREEFYNEYSVMREIQKMKSEQNLAENDLLELIGYYKPGNFGKEYKTELLVTRFMENGDVESFCKSEQGNILTLGLALAWCKELANALSVLKSLSIVHRDVAARNCFLDENLSLNLGDYGLSRVNKETEAYTMMNLNREIPIMWTAPEVVSTACFSYESDMWAVGITFWEFFTKCVKIPYLREKAYPSGNLFVVRPVSEFFNQLDRGDRLEMPAGMPSGIYDLLYRESGDSCLWHADVKKRINPDDLKLHLEKLTNDMQRRKELDWFWI